MRETDNWENLTYQEKIDKVKNKIISYRPLMKKAILFRYNNVKNLKPKNVPILFMAGALARLGAEDSIEPLLRSTKSSVSYGYVGLSDIIDIITDRKHNINDEVGANLSIQLIETLKNEVDILKEELQLPVSLYATPFESGIYTNYKADLEQFGDLMPKWLIERGYYTNSFHFPSEVSIDAFEKIKAESKFHKYSNGGNISYVENSGRLSNYTVAIELMQYAYKQGIEYFGVNTVSNKCQVCGYIGDIPYDEKKNTYVCPQCQNDDSSKLDITLRCCGYLGKYSLTKAVKGRTLEMKNRVKHIKQK